MGRRSTYANRCAPRARSYLAGDAPAAAIAAGGAAGRAGPYATPQRAGFCFARAVFGAVRYIATAVWRWEAASVKALMLLHRVVWLEPAVRELETAGTEPAVSDVSFALLAARQTARAACKAVLRGHLTDAGFSVVDALARAAVAALERVNEAWGLMVPGLADDGRLGGDDAPRRRRIPTLALDVARDALLGGDVAAWPRWEHVARLARSGAAVVPSDSASDELMGAPAASEAPRHRAVVAFEHPAPAAGARWGLMDVVAAVKASTGTAGGLERLSEEGLVDTPHLHLLVAEVESLLLERLPPPQAGPGANRHHWNCAPAPAAFTRAVQCDALSDAAELLKCVRARVSSSHTHWPHARSDAGCTSRASRPRAPASREA